MNKLIEPSDKYVARIEGSKHFLNHPKHMLNHEKLIGGFTYENGWHDIIMNKALVIGSTRGGNSTSCKSKKSDILLTKDWGLLKWRTKEYCETYLDRMGF